MKGKDAHLKKIKDLISAMNKAGLKKLSLKVDGFEVELEKSAPEDPPVIGFMPSSQPHTAPIQLPTQETAQSVSAALEQKAEGKFVDSPMVGTFYGASSPDAFPYVKVGDSVEAHTVICIIEAMKVMNEIKAGASGTITEVLVDNGDPVEFGTKLFKIS